MECSVSSEEELEACRGGLLPAEGGKTSKQKHWAFERALNPEEQRTGLLPTLEHTGRAQEAGGTPSGSMSLALVQSLTLCIH